MKEMNEHYSVVIIDDEPHVIEGLKTMIDWESYNYEIVNTFNQSDCALEYILHNQIDLVITDVRMPVIDGLEIVKIIKNRLLQTKVLIMSGYRDFEYVKKAMEYGASKYLVKPIFDEDICSTLNEFALDFENQKMEKLFQESFHEESLKLFLNDSLEDEKLLSIEMFYNTLFAENNWYVLSLWKGFDGIDRAVRLEILKIFDESYRFIEVFHQQFGAIFIISCNPDLIEDRIKNSTSISKWKFSKPITSIGNLKDEYQKVKKNLSRYNHFNDSFNNIESETVFIDEEWSRDVVEALNRLDKIGIQNLLKHYFKFCEKEKLSARKVLQGIMGQYSKITHSFRNILEEEISGKEAYSYHLDMDKLTYEMILVFIEERLYTLIETIEKTQKNCKDSFKCLIEEHIKKHYNEELTIKELADYVHMHPTYLGQKLKILFGESFTSYLNRVRIERSKDLLKDSNTTHIKEVACQVGYGQYHVFLKYFKKYNKMTPKEFLK